MFSNVVGSKGVTFTPTTIDKNIKILREFSKVLTNLMYKIGLGKNKKQIQLRVAAKRC